MSTGAQWAGKLATGAVETIRVASALTIDPGYLSNPEAFQFSTERGLTAHEV
jgi:hypothetical protein